MSRTIYKNARIITGTGEVIENGMIVVNHKQKDFEAPAPDEEPVKIAPSTGDTIEYVGAWADCWEAEETVDVSGNTVLPGLIDCAARLDTLYAGADDYVDNIGIAYRTYISYRNAAEALNCGVTTLRAQGMPNNIDIALKNAINKTMFFGPSILATGPIYAVTAGKGHEKYGLIECSGTDAFRAQMRIHVSRGLEGVTLQVTGDRLATLGGEYHKEMSDAEINALIKQAAGAEKPTAVRASGDLSVDSCIKAGAHCIQEGYWIGEALLTKMAERGVAYVPCLVTSAGTEMEAEHKAVVSAAIRAGVKIAVGTEILPSEPMAGTVAVIREMELLVEAGMSPMEAIQAATTSAAKVCKCKAGVLENGGKADFVIVEGKPDENISAMRNMKAVVKSGRRVFNQMNGEKERQFHIHAPLYEVSGGAAVDWTEGALMGVKEPANYNTEWNLVKEF